MIVRIATTLVFLLVISSGICADPKIVQSMDVDFPVSGHVLVEVREEVGKFPQMIFSSQTTQRVLLRSSIEDKERFLIPEADTAEKITDLRFGVIHSNGFRSPMIMAVGVYRGGSDNAYFLTVFGEVGGSIVRLTEKPIFANIQGGYYLGYLSKRLGYGLAVWNFVWETGAHYSEHKYEMDIYQQRGIKLNRTLRRTSRKTYDSDNGSSSLSELGIKATDQRKLIPVIKDSF
jgi:hypothetical protein